MCKHSKYTNTHTHTHALLNWCKHHMYSKFCVCLCTWKLFGFHFSILFSGMIASTFFYSFYYYFRWKKCITSTKDWFIIEWYVHAVYYMAFVYFFKSWIRLKIGNHTNKNREYGPTAMPPANATSLKKYNNKSNM